jgi:hypothetical protein
MFWREYGRSGTFLQNVYNITEYMASQPSDLGGKLPPFKILLILTSMYTTLQRNFVWEFYCIDLRNHGARYALADMSDVNKTVHVRCQTMFMLLQEVQKMKNIDELEAFMLKHGENIVDMMGAEIDRIEMKLRVSTLTSLETQTFLCNTVKKSTNLFSYSRVHIS